MEKSGVQNAPPTPQLIRIIQDYTWRIRTILRILWIILDHTHLQNCKKLQKYNLHNPCKHGIISIINV